MRRQVWGRRILTASQDEFPDAEVKAVCSKCSAAVNDTISAAGRTRLVAHETAVAI